MIKILKYIIIDFYNRLILNDEYINEPQHSFNVDSISFQNIFIKMV